MKKHLLSTVLLAAVCSPAYAQDAPASPDQIAGSHPECSFFGAQRERFLKATPTRSHLGQMTVQVAGMVPAPLASSSRAATASLPPRARRRRRLVRAQAQTTNKPVHQQSVRA